MFKEILKETTLNKLGSLLPPECEVAIQYLRNLREIHRICLGNEIDQDTQLIFNDFEQNFDTL